MKSRVFVNATLLGVLLMPFAHAQLASGLKAKIAFEFCIGDTKHAAGEYSVSRNIPGTKVLLIRNLDYKAGATMFNSTQVEAKTTDKKSDAKLVFHRYGKTHFLSQVWGGSGENSGLKLNQSKAERDILHQMASSRKPDTIEIALVSFDAQHATHRAMR